MNVPDHLRYSKDHEWATLTDSGAVRVGITDYAQDALGDVVFVQLPTEGALVSPGQATSEVESTKSVSEIYAPLGGRVTLVNSQLTDEPELLNTDPYGDGWILEITPDDPTALDELLDAAAYRSLIDG
jgi:glycine cleavage system H protein